MEGILAILIIIAIMLIGISLVILKALKWK